jgi:hypothetical protein
MGVGHRSDLVVTELTGPTSVRDGDPFIATVKVCNQGTENTSGWGNSYVELYLSMDATLTAPSMSGPPMPPPTDQRMIGSVPVPSLAAGQCVSQAVNVHAYLPPEAQGSDGTALYLGAIVDPYQSEQELREDNNITVGGLMGVGYRPDLVVTELTGPTTVREGDPFTSTVKVCNQGTSPLGNIIVELYISTGTTLTPPGPGPMSMDQRMVASVQAGPLTEGQCETLSVSAYAYLPPMAQGPGSYFLGAFVDPFQSEQELREDNNTRAGFALEVTW